MATQNQVQEGGLPRLARYQKKFVHCVVSQHKREVAMTKKEQKEEYGNVFVEAGIDGWVIRIKNGPPEVFVNWSRLVRRLEVILTSRGSDVG